MSNVSAVLLRRIGKAARHEPRGGKDSDYQLHEFFPLPWTTRFIPAFARLPCVQVYSHCSHNLCIEMLRDAIPALRLP